VRKQQVEEVPLPPRHFAPNLPTSIDPVIMRSLIKNPEIRFQTADEFRSALLSIDITVPRTQAMSLPSLPTLVREDRQWVVPDLPRPPFEGTGEYIFVSYKREDMPRVARLLHSIIGLGHKIWYDSGIPGGENWKKLIAIKLRSCKSLVVFVSKASAESDWVRNEVSYAHDKRKPILGIKLEEAELEDELDLILSRTQIISARSRDFSDQLKRALDNINRTGRPK
jgi:hypothetical protein